MEARKAEPNQQLLLQFFTTEHFTLQTGRSATISEANGRCSMYFNALSGVVVALAFIGQMSGMGETFFVFGFVLFPPLLFLGLATYVRVLQLGVEDIIYARGINRIRHFYTEVAPEAEKYFILSTHDDVGSASLRHLGIIAPWWQMFMTAAGVVEVINGVVAGTLFGIMANQLLRLEFWPSLGIGALAFLIVLVLQHQYGFQLWDRVERRITDLFPLVDRPAAP